MAKDRGQRYKSADDVIIDLEYLLNGEPPKMARNKIEAGTLAALAQGDLEEEDDDAGVSRQTSSIQTVWIGVLGALLAVSFLINLVLFLRRG